VTGDADAAGNSCEVSPVADVDDFVQIQHVMNALTEPVLRGALQALHLPSGSRGLDAGCGIGLQTLFLAEAVGPAGHVTGLDLSPQYLACAQGMVGRAGLAQRISFREGDVNNLPFEDGAFDWAWSVDCVGYMPDPAPLKELARVVRPGGAVAVLVWSSERLLPGYPLLQARLDTTTAGLAPFARGMTPEMHFLRKLGWMRDCGLEDTTARTFAGGAHAPLSPAERAALVALFCMRWPGVPDGTGQALQPELSEEERAEFERLCLPQSPDFVVDQPDYYAFFTYSMFAGRVAGAG
jgi:ubiquinone/menaquinone biosynthesis C-methylase UbiE